MCKRRGIKGKKKGIKRIIACIGLLLILIILGSLVFLGNYRRNYCSGNCPDWMWNQPFAHRGLHADDDIDENSMGAFKAAVEAGYAIELDLRYTKDMVPMVSHDNDLSRVVGKKVNLSDITYEEAKTLTLQKSGEKIPSLEEVLAFIDDQVPLLIEIKSYHLPGEFERNIVEILKGYTGRYAFQSYNPFALKMVKELNPNVAIGLLLDDVPGIPVIKSARILKDNLFGMVCHPEFITYNVKLLEEHELDIYRSDNNLVLGFLFTEQDINEKNYLPFVDGIVFERTGQ